MRERLVIAVCGAGSCDETQAELAATAGRLLADAGATLVCGGLYGVMEAACRGAAAAGGITIGILPGTDRRAANPSVAIPIVTGMGEARNLVIVQTADAVLAIGGEYGTLSEIALARKIGRPVVGLQTWDLGSAADGTPHIFPAHTPQEAVTLVLDVARQRRKTVSGA